MVGFALFGAGVIGTIHARNIALHPEYQLIHVVDSMPDKAKKLTEMHGGTPGMEIDQALEDERVDVVIIGSSTSAHEAQVLACAKAGKAFLCEKPISDSLEGALHCIKAVEEAGIATAMGFNRRLYYDYQSVFDRVRTGQIGKVEMIHVVSRTNKAPIPETIPFSGGMIREKGTHFFDMASWISELDPVEIYAAGACLIDKRFVEYGQVDTASLVLRLEDDVLVSLDFSLRAIFGQDELIEIVGSEGMLQCGRQRSGNTFLYTEGSIATEGVQHSWYEQFKQTYSQELDALVATVTQSAPAHATLRDGLRAQAVAEAAIQSISQNQPVKIEKVW
jgi:myo-inositol 2-dehydrogenase/D-chiro-inositol 1-dehydrogenase